MSQLIAAYGGWMVAAAVGLESMGIPVPGETTLITAAIYAGTTHRLNIAVVVLAAALGAIAGDSMGFLIGRRLGGPWLSRHGAIVYLPPQRLRLAQYLFRKHGGKIVFFGRFVALLRAFAAFLAGSNGMPWHRFLVFNAAGGALWAATYGIGSYLFGETITTVERPVGLVLIALAVAAAAAGVLYVRRHEQELALHAERELGHPM